ncbi:MAG TPA: penicillin acylase family protein [Acetobacteraceae bacterium]|nr:penicillin acylase family protein [Acetobacteraceae bacterium]
MLRLARTLLTSIGVVLLLLAVGFAGLLWLTVPSRNQSASIPGLSAPVDIRFDEHGIPRIRAATLVDAAAALGYVHARDRMFQLDLMRRAASGRLSEIAGPATLPIDKEMRVLGLRVRAMADYAALPPDERAILEAYSAGVNAWIGAHGRFSAPEFILLGAPEAWSPVDCLLWGKTMGMWLSMNWRQELARLRLSAHLPAALVDALWPAQHEAGEPAAMRGSAIRYAAVGGMPLPAFPAPFTQPDHASNEWAVDGSHTATGAPLLAGDPHLAFGFPSLWYLVRIDTPDQVLAGASAPGVPGVVLGRNSHIAWTFTTTGADVQDIFIESPVGADQYQTPNGPKPFALREERIRVRGQPDTVLTVRETRHGPVVSDLMDPGGPVLAVSMANLQPGDTAAAGLLALNRARTVEEAGKAAAMISSPVQNLLVADAKSIGLYVTGRVPIRKSGNGEMPVSGADGAFDWVGWASGEQLPHYVAPASGRLVNANERIAPPEFPVFLGRDWFGDWRARRIRELLGRSDRHTAADFARMQMDVKSLFAEQVLPTLLSIAPAQGVAGKALALLDGWDGTMAMDKPQPLIFAAWIDRFYAALLQRAGVTPSGAGAVAPTAEFVASVLLRGGAHWCGGDCAGMLQATLNTAVADLAREYGPDPASWRWGDAHQAEFAHPLLRAIPGLRGFGTLRIPAPGSATTIDAAGTTFGGFTALHGPEYRGVYDLADLDRSLFMMAPGQSGNLLSRHSRDLLRSWRDGETLTLGPEPSRVAATLRLMQ